MNYKLLLKKESHYPLFLGEEAYILNRREKTVYKTKDFNTVLWETESLNGEVFLNGSNSVLFSTEDLIYFVNSTSGEILDIENLTLLENNSSINEELDKILCYRNPRYVNKTWIKEMGYFNSESDLFEVIDENFEMDYLMKYEDSFLVKTNNSLKFYDNNFNQKWVIDISILNVENTSKIKQIIGFHNSLIWIHLEGLKLVSIDIETGKKMNFFENILRGGEIFGNNFLDKKNGIIKIFSSYTYSEFDLNQLKLTKEIEIGFNNSLLIRNSNYNQENMNIYFCASLNEDYPNLFGVFDTQSCRIVWYDLLEKENKGNAFYNAPISNQKYIIIVDNLNTMRVYEKEFTN